MAKTTVAGPSVATVIKRLRKEQGWSLSVCAEKTGISKAMLGQIERKESSPTLATLWKLATGFGVSLSSLILGADTGQARPSEQVSFDRGDIGVETLLPFDEVSRQEVYRLAMKPGSESFSEAHLNGTTETLYVLSGQLDVWLAGAWQPLEEGQAFRFQADQQHGYRNPTDRDTVFHDVISYR